MKKIVLTYYCTGVKDIWHHTDDDIKKPDVEDFTTLRKSVAGRDYDFVTIANELETDLDDWKIEKMVGELERPKEMSLYVHKFIACYKYLIQHPEYEEIWITDSSDVEMLKTPSPKDGLIFTGWDAYFPAFDRYANFLWFLGGPSRCGVWVPQGFGRGKRHGDFEFRYLQDCHLEDRPWNCGIFGGKRDMVMKFLKDYTDRLSRNDMDLEMVPFNYLCYTKYKDKVVSCTTRMTAHERDYNKWWRHK